MTGQSRDGSRDSITAIRSGSGTVSASSANRPKLRSCSVGVLAPAMYGSRSAANLSQSITAISSRGLPRRVDLAGEQLLERQPAAELRGHVRPRRGPDDHVRAGHVLPGLGEPGEQARSSTRSPRPRPRRAPAPAAVIAVILPDR